MERLKTLCNFLNSILSASAASFLTFAVSLHDVRFIYPGVVLAIIDGIIVYNLIKSEREKEEEN